MTFDLANAVRQVQLRIQDKDAKYLTADDVQEYLQDAIRMFSRDMPRDVIAEFLGTGAAYYDMPTYLPSYSENFSSIKWVDYPAATIASGDAPNRLEQDTDWQVHDVPLSSVRTLYLYFTMALPKATETVRIGYTGLHTIEGLNGADVTTIPAAFETAFYHLAAFHCLSAIAIKMAQKGNSTIGADVSDFQSLSREIRLNAQMQMDAYKSEVNSIMMNSASGTPADEFLNWDSDMSWGNDFLFHPRRLR